MRLAVIGPTTQSKMTLKDCAPDLEFGQRAFLEWSLIKGGFK